MMDLNKLKGINVIKKNGQEDVIVDAKEGSSDIIVTLKNGGKFALSSCKISDYKISKKVIETINEIKAKRAKEEQEKRDAERAKIAAEEAERKAREQEEREAALAQKAMGGKRTKTLPSGRLSGHRMAYWVFQGDNYQKESSGGYISAPVTNIAGQEIHTYRRLCEVVPGDLIFHACDGYIKAISIVQAKAETFEESYREYRKVQCEYFILENPIRHGDYKDEIIEATRGVLYSPFTKDGNGNLGYLYELGYRLSKFFLNIIIKNNSSVADLDAVKELLSI